MLITPRLLETVIDLCTLCGPTTLDILEHAFFFKKKQPHHIQRGLNYRYDTY